MSVAQAAGAQPVITVNYGSNSAGTGGGDPNEAAAWVRYANSTKHYGVSYWEIGNEVYGNGTYGANWETDLHAQKGPAASTRCSWPAPGCRGMRRERRGSTWTTTAPRRTAPPVPRTAGGTAGSTASSIPRRGR